MTFSFTELFLNYCYLFFSTYDLPTNQLKTKQCFCMFSFCSSTKILFRILLIDVWIMFCRNILRDLKILTSLTCSNKNTLIHPRYSYIFYNDHKQLHVQVPNSQYAFNYSKNQSNEFPDKLSRTLICCKYLRLIKNAVRGEFITYIYIFSYSSSVICIYH